MGPVDRRAGAGPYDIDAATALAWSSSGTLLAVADRPGTISVFDAIARAEIRRFSVDPMMIDHATSLAWSADDAWLVAVATGRDAAGVYDLATGNRLFGFEDNTYAVAFSPDGTRVATVTQPTEVRVWDLATGTRTKTMRFSFSPSRIGRMIWTDQGLFTADDEIGAVEPGLIVHLPTGRSARDARRTRSSTHDSIHERNVWRTARFSSESATA